MDHDISHSSLASLLGKMLATMASMHVQRSAEQRRDKSKLIGNTTVVAWLLWIYSDVNQPCPQHSPLDSLLTQVPSIRAITIA